MKTRGFKTFVTIISFAIAIAHMPPVIADVSAIDTDVGEPESLCGECIVQRNELLSNPVDINTASLDDFQQIPGLTRNTARRIIAYRKKYGSYHSVNELAVLLNKDLLDTISPYLAVSYDDFYLASGVFHVESLYMGLSGDQMTTPVPSNLRWTAKSTTGSDIGVSVSVDNRWTAVKREDAAFLQSSGAETGVKMEHAYYYHQNTNSGFYLGSYNAGFGNSLTFDMTSRREPDGVYSPKSVVTDMSAGKLKSAHNMFGIAVTRMKPIMQSANLKGTAFFSGQSLPAYQYDVRYRADDWIAPALGDCDKTGKTSKEFVCGQDGYWYSSSIMTNEGESLHYLTIENAFSESIAGGHIAYGRDGFQLGLTGYTATLALNIQNSDLFFSPSARYGEENKFAAVGVDYKIMYDDAVISGEISRTNSQGNAIYIDGQYAFNNATEISASYRYYSPEYSNPYGRGYAAFDEVFGLRQRNEQGLVMALIQSEKSYHSKIKLDVWENPYRFVEASGNGVWAKDYDAPTALAAHYELGLDVTTKTACGFSFDYTNKDIAHNGRKEHYESTEAGVARGERRVLSIHALHTSPGLITHKIAITSVWQDVATLPSFEKQYSAIFNEKFHYSSALSFGGSMRYRLGDMGIERPAFTRRIEAGRVFLNYAFTKRLLFGLRYGYESLSTENADQYVKSVVEWHFN